LGVVKAWISLDSLVRIETYQWVTGDFQRKIFPRAFGVAKAPWKRQTPHDRDTEGMDCSLGKPSLISGFLQEIAAQALPFGLPPSKSKSF
jgi:hypothetical protein